MSNEEIIGYAIDNTATTDDDYINCIKNIKIPSNAQHTIFIGITNYGTSDLTLELVSGGENKIKVKSTRASETASSPCCAWGNGRLYEFFPFVKGVNVGEEFTCSISEDLTTTTGNICMTQNGEMEVNPYVSDKGCYLEFIAHLSEDKATILSIESSPVINDFRGQKKASAKKTTKRRSKK